MGGFENDVVVAKNVNFDGSSPKPHLGIINAAGKLLIGTGSTFPIPEILGGSIISPDSSIIIGYSSPNITLSAGGSVPTTFTEDVGTASPALNNLNVLGGHDMNTAGSGSTITIALNNAITLGDLSAIAAGSNALSATTGDINIDSGNIKLPATSATGPVGLLKIGGSNFLNALGTQNTFVGVSGNLTFTVASATLNTGIGFHSLLSITTANENTAVGNQAIQNNQTANANTGIGSQSLKKATGAQNTGVGASSGVNFTTGTNNTLIGYSTGSNYTTSESNNILIGANVNGTLAESNVTRIGSGQTKFFAVGIDGVNVGSTATVVTEASNQLGTAVITAGTGISITPGANTITIANTSPATFSPNATVNLFDDFIGCVPASGSIPGQLDWFQNATNWNSGSPIEAGHPGMLQNSGLTTGVYALMFAAQSSAGNLTILLGGGAITLNWVFKIVNLSNSTNRYTLRLGFGDTNSNADQANGCYVEYSDNLNSGNWNFKTANASSRTTSNSSTAVTTGWHNVQISINAAASSVSFSMDGVSLGTAISTNIPTTNPVNIMATLIGVGGTTAAGSIFVDLMYYSQTLTTPR